MLLPTLTFAQSVVTGGLTGTVMDSSGAVVVGATATLKNNLTTESSTTTSNGSGIYAFSLQKPGDYVLTVTRQGFKTVTENVTITLGQVAAYNVTLEVGSGSTTVEVTAQGQLLQTENANITTNFDTKKINEVPNPGGDITYIANTAPGITTNNSTVGGYGNFSAFGLPADANLFTVNGNDYNDPFLNLNNTGASNLLLGGNELQEIAVVANGYTGQYGRQAGAQIDYTTKSGGNAFHGDAVYFWTGRAFTANDPINKLFGGTRPFANNNQWAASLGGPIKKNKAFFFLNTEGIRYIFGSIHTITLMQPDFQSYVLKNIPQDAATQAFYTNMFNLYNAAPGIAKEVRNSGQRAANNLAGGCGGTDVGGSFIVPGGTPASPIVDPITGLPLPASLQDGGCTGTYTQSVPNGNKEWLLAGRFDWDINDTNKIFGRAKFDRGTQPTYTDSINPVFNDSSVQPQNEGQLNYTHVFSPTIVNNFVGSILYYSAIFGNPNPAAALALFPGNIAFVDGTGTTALGTGSGNPGGFAQGFEYPQGRNVTQWQLIDDLAITRGAHSFKMGFNFRRDDVTDFASSTLTQYPAINSTLANFANDIVNSASGGNILYNFAIHSRQPLAFYSLGLYFQDEWRVNSKLKLTMTIRADRNSPGVCQKNCATLPVTSFNNMPHGADIPYNAAFPGGSFQTGLHNILPNVEKVVFEPRFGFAWQPWGQNTVLRGGVGLFTDLYPGVILGNYTTNFPQVNTWNVGAGSLAFDLNPPASTAFPTSGVNIIGECNGAFATNFNTAPGTLTSYAALASGINGGCKNGLGNLIVPNLNDTSGSVQNPKYVEWNFEIQRTLSPNTIVSLNYVGNYGYDELVQNGYLNGFCDPVTCSAPIAGGGAGFTNSGLPATAPDPRVASVLQLSNVGYSHYNGLTASIQENNWHGLSGRVNYTYSHSLDANSNGGINPFSVINSVLNQIDPFNIRRDYATSDNDVRHNLSANYVYVLPFKSEKRLLNAAIGGWQLSGTFFWHTGFPFSILDGATLGKFQSNNLQFATILSQPQFATRNFSNSNPCAAGLILGPACFGPNSAANTFAPSTTFIGDVVGRNAFQGPGFFGADASVRKTFNLTERFALQIGFNAYNVLNHLNYGTASANSSGALGPFGYTIFTATMPTSPYGAFAAAATDMRMCQIQGKLIF
jgi:hypothetical protein